MRNDEFYRLGLRAGLPEAVVRRELALFQTKNEQVESLIDQSLPELLNILLKTCRDYVGKCI